TFDHLRGSSDARAAYQRAVDLDPEHDTARLCLADSLRDASQPQQALPHYQRLRQRNPGNPDILLGLGMCHMALGEQNEARGLLDALVTNFPRHPGGLVQRGKLELDASQPVKAEVWLRKAVLVAPYDRDSAYNMLLCLRQLDRKD